MDLDTVQNILKITLLILLIAMIVVVLSSCTVRICSCGTMDKNLDVVDGNSTNIEITIPKGF